MRELLLVTVENDPSAISTLILPANKEYEEKKVVGINHVIGALKFMIYGILYFEEVVKASK